MTLIAAICPASEAPFFVSDTLVSEPGRRDGRILSPNGVILPAESESGLRPNQLQQKNIVIQDRTFAAYAGESVAAYGAFRRLLEALATQPPSREVIDAKARRLKTVCITG